MAMAAWACVAQAVGLRSSRDLPDTGPCDDAVCIPRHAACCALSLYPVNAYPRCMVVSASRTQSDLQEPFVGGELVGHPYLKWMLAKGESGTPSMGKVELYPMALLRLPCLHSAGEAFRTQGPRQPQTSPL